VAITAAPSGAAFLLPGGFTYALRGLFFKKSGIVSRGMNWSQLTNGVKQIWENDPGVVVLLALGFLVFLFIVLDARRHRQRNKDKHPRKY
jgi:hypothetical protein